MESSELIAELLQEINNDIQHLKQWSQRVPVTAPPDYVSHFERLAGAVEQLGQQVQKQAPSSSPSVDTSGIDEQLTRIEQAIYKRPEYRISRYIQFGAYAFGLMVLVTAGMSWQALTWKEERDKFAVSDWKVRLVQQERPNYSAHLSSVFPNDSIKPEVTEWIGKQEQADINRAAAHKAAQQAAAMNAQADQLEGKPKGKKKY